MNEIIELFESIDWRLLASNACALLEHALGFGSIFLLGYGVHAFVRFNREAEEDLEAIEDFEREPGRELDAYLNEWKQTIDI